MSAGINGALGKPGQALWKQMLIFFLPILFGTFFQQLYNTVDAMIVGKFVGKEALAAVGGSSGAIVNLLVGFFVGLSNGATVIIAQCVGSGDQKTAQRAVHTAIALAIAAGAALTVLGLLLGGVALGWMGTPEEVFGLSRQYLAIFFLGMIPNLVYNFGSGILRAAGNSKGPLHYLMAACLINIVLDLLFVALFRWGVAGVAAATVLAQIGSALLVLRAMVRSRGMCHLDLRQLRFHGKTLARIVRIGIPSGIQSAMYAISNLLIQASINSFGADTMAAWTAFTKLDALNWMGSGAFGTAVATFGGQSYGAGDYGRMRQTVRSGTVMNTVYAGCLSLVMVCFGRHAMGLFLDDPAVIAYGETMIRYISTGYILFIPIELLAAICRSAGDTLKPTLMTAGGICGYRVLWIYTALALKHTRQMLYLCYPISWVITSALFIAYYYRGSWLGPEGRARPGGPV